MKRYLDYTDLYPEQKGVFVATNESLPAIVAGLDLQPKDRVLAIAGSGDQAFAMLEFADEVVATDINPDQLRLTEFRKRALKDGKIFDFIDPPIVKAKGEFLSMTVAITIMQRNAYFAEGERYKRIKPRLNRLRVLPPQDIRQAILPERDCNKFYLSNAYHPRSDNFKGVYEAINSLGPGRLIYISQGTLSQRGMKVDKTLTKKARDIEARGYFRASPVVFRT